MYVCMYAGFWFRVQKNQSTPAAAAANSFPQPERRNPSFRWCCANPHIHTHAPFAIGSASLLISRWTSTAKYLAKAEACREEKSESSGRAKRWGGRGHGHGNGNGAGNGHGHGHGHGVTGRQASRKGRGKKVCAGCSPRRARAGTAPCAHAHITRGPPPLTDRRASRLAT